MHPSGLALHHPAADRLLQYATKGCPAETGQDWTMDMIQAAIDRGPHKSAMTPEAMEYIQSEAFDKERIGKARIVEWIGEFKRSPPAQLKVSPIAAIPHKSRAFRSILDLSFILRLLAGGTVPSVNMNTVKTAPRAAINQIGHVLKRLIHAFAEAPEDAKIFMAKWDVKDGFWRLNNALGDEYNFAYVLPQEPGATPKLVIPTSLQMGWIESPPYFCAASETGRDVAAQYINTPIGSLPTHKFQQLTEASTDFEALPESGSGELATVCEVYVNDYIVIATPSSREQLRHVANAVLTGIHDVFPPDDDDSNDPISHKKILKGEDVFALEKDLLGFDFNGEPGQHTMWLEAPKRDKLLTILHGWCRAGADRNLGIPFDVFRSTTYQLRWAFISIPQGNGLLSPFNKVLAKEPRFVFLHRNKHLFEGVRDCRTLLRESVAEPTRCKELVQGWPDYIGVKDASKHGVGGIIVGESKACIPTVFRLEWPADIKADLVSEQNPNGRITNSDLELAGMVILWLIMEAVCSDLADAHCALFSDNSPTIGWVRRLASKYSTVAAQLLRVLALRLKKKKASPLTPLHIGGTQNAMTDVPSRSFGSNAKWHCKTDCELLTLFNRLFPLPNKSSWTVFRPTYEISMRVICVLRMQDSTLAEWRKLPRIGSHTGVVGTSCAGLWEWTLRYRLPALRNESEHSRLLRVQSELERLVEENKSKLAQSVAQSQPLERRSLWTSE